LFDFSQGHGAAFSPDSQRHVRYFCRYFQLHKEHKKRHTL